MNLKHRCPECNLFTLKCNRTMPIDIGDHELECSRVSYWKCKNCESMFELKIPMGKLRKIATGKHT